MNRSQVKRPRWRGTSGEYAVVVSRGEPRRTDEEMFTWVKDQVHHYIELHGPIPTPPPSVRHRAAELIAADHINRQGAQNVTLSREHLLRYVELAAASPDEVHR